MATVSKVKIDWRQRRWFVPFFPQFKLGFLRISSSRRRKRRLEEPRQYDTRRRQRPRVRRQRDVRKRSRHARPGLWCIRELPFDEFLFLRLMLLGDKVYYDGEHQTDCAAQHEANTSHQVAAGRVPPPLRGGVAARHSVAPGGACVPRGHRVHVLSPRRDRVFAGHDEQSL